MIIQPPLDKLMEKVDSRYTLVIATAKRARQLTEDKENKSVKPVIDAVQDIINDRVDLDFSGDTAKAEKIDNIERAAEEKAAEEERAAEEAARIAEEAEKTEADEA